MVWTVLFSPILILLLCPVSTPQRSRSIYYNCAVPLIGGVTHIKPEYGFIHRSFHTTGVVEYYWNGSYCCRCIFRLSVSVVTVTLPQKTLFFLGGGRLCSRIETTAMTFAFVTFALGKTAPLLKADKFQMYFSNLALKVSLLVSQ